MALCNSQAKLDAHKHSCKINKDKQKETVKFFSSIVLLQKTTYNLFELPAGHDKVTQQSDKLNKKRLMFISVMDIKSQCDDRY